MGLNNSTASNSTAVSTNFNVSTEETGSFYEGFLKPIDLTILDYFIRQGYPRELLFWLFTDSFEIIYRPKSMWAITTNPPSDLGCDPNDPKHRCFGDWIHIATLSGLTVEEQTQQKGSSSGARSGGSGSANSGGGSKPTTYTYARFCFRSGIGRAGAGSNAAPILLQYLSMTSMSPSHRCTVVTVRHAGRRLGSRRQRLTSRNPTYFPSNSIMGRFNSESFRVQLTAYSNFSEHC